LNDDCDITFAGLTSGVENRWSVHVIGDGTHVATFPDVLWPDGIAPEFDATAGSHWLEFVSTDGSTIYGDFGGSTTASPGATASRPVMAFDPSDSHWYVVVDGTGTAVVAEG
jgi:hypothetical protein